MKNILAKRLTEIQKKVIINDFVNGVTIDQLSKRFSCTKLTIVRNLKKNLSESKYNSILKINKASPINISEIAITPNQLATNNEENNILLNAAKLCKVGGKIVYITCSLLYDENEFQIKSFLNNFKNFDTIYFREDITKYIKKEMFKYNKYGLTLGPDVLNTDGYFISMLKKTA